MTVRQRFLFTTPASRRFSSLKAKAIFARSKEDADDNRDNSDKDQRNKTEAVDLAGGLKGAAAPP